MLKHKVAGLSGVVPTVPNYSELADALVHGPGNLPTLSWRRPASWSTGTTTARTPSVTSVRGPSM
eukprot:3291894-Lingulodinium_polyedra.AAC.1